MKNLWLSIVFACIAGGLVPQDSMARERLIEEKPFAEHFLLLHISESDPIKQDLVLSVANNVLKAYGPDQVEIEVVAFGQGIELLKRSNHKASRISLLAAQGVRFYACEISLSTHQKKAGQPFPLHPQAQQVNAGVPYMMQQQKSGYILIKP